MSIENENQVQESAELSDDDLEDVAGGCGHKNDYKKDNHHGHHKDHHDDHHGNHGHHGHDDYKRKQERGY